MVRILRVAAVGVCLAVIVAISAMGGHSTAGHGRADLPPVAATPTPTPTPTAPAILAPAVPTTFQLTGPGFVVRANVCQMANVRPLDPPGEQHHTVCWVKSGFGVAPGTDSGGTSYVLGHAWAEDSREVLNPLSIFAMDHVATTPTLDGGVATYPVSGLGGSTITLHTASGTLTYAIDKAFTVAKNQAGYVPDLMAANTPDRVVLITCGVHDGRDIDVNVIVFAALQSAVASAA